MIRDRAILARFNPDGSFCQQYLGRDQALFCDDEWHWQAERVLAYVFDSHGEAETFAREHPYEGADGRAHEPWALVLGGAEAFDEEEAARVTARKQAKRMTAVVRCEVSRAEAPAPEEVFEQLERRHLA